MVEWLILAVSRGCLQFVIVVFPDHTHLLFFSWLAVFNQMKIVYTICNIIIQPDVICFHLPVSKQRMHWLRIFDH